MPFFPIPETLDFFRTLTLLYPHKTLSSMASPFLLLLLLLLLIIVPLSVLSFLVRPKPVKIPLKGRHVLISGGSSGIGLSLARLSAGAGARVSILARNRARLDEAVESVRRATGAEARAFSADVRDYEAVRRAVEEAGPVDVLICNHGVFTPQELEAQDLEEVRFIVEVNLMGTFHLIKAALPEMKRRAKETGLPASIAIMSSQAGQVGVYSYTAYSASKFGLRGLGEALQHEVVADNIHVSIIFPPDTETPGLAEEQKRRPELASIIVGSSGEMKADDVAAKALNGIQSARFIVPCNFEGTMLSIATAGLSPQTSSLAALAEVFGAGFMRFLGLCFQWNWFSAIDKYTKKQRGSM
ncbi:putative 3-dehydrosphinganine reductase TSC10A [Iris pallida]|uniref:3-dehydrosphinganine reductase n=1 Tax=Iris pallida TaxID=29817 RepID=A0AAX6ILL1_IRIPA|nr:putative 3-dehydrosphinganine reductase TSC10A [Iris pallida]KAJ6854142.1 putative 3-dehydrosphinganine reductase TSC10A [Iris pallida]